MKLVDIIEQAGLEQLFQDFKWYRKAKGGMWLKYQMGFPAYSHEWYNVVEYDGVSPSPFCVGTPARIEVYSV